MKKVDLETIRHFYNNVPSAWPDGDIWHVHSREQILKHLHKCEFLFGSSIINAGSGGSDYFLNYDYMLHVDIAEEKIKHHDDFLVSTIENLPIESSSFDNAICVGSVLNYCDPVSSISELWRVLKPGGRLILEYESSWGYEYLGKREYKKDAIVTSIEYLDAQHNQWLFSPQYIKGILAAHHFELEKEYKFHIVDGIVSKLLNERLSIAFSKTLDSVACKVPFVRNHANNIMYICRKS